MTSPHFQASRADHRSRDSHVMSSVRNPIDDIGLPATPRQRSARRFLRLVDEPIIAQRRAFAALIAGTHEPLTARERICVALAASRPFAMVTLDSGSLDRDQAAKA